MNASDTVIRRMVADLESGRAHWVPRPAEAAVRIPRPKTAEDRRAYDAERKARQRAEARGQS